MPIKIKGNQIADATVAAGNMKTASETYDFSDSTSFKVPTVASGDDANVAATKSYADSIAAGLHWHDSVFRATNNIFDTSNNDHTINFFRSSVFTYNTTNKTLTKVSGQGTVKIDGWAPAAGDFNSTESAAKRVLLKDGSAQVNASITYSLNGIPGASGKVIDFQAHSNQPNPAGKRSFRITFTDATSGSSDQTWTGNGSGNAPHYTATIIYDSTSGSEPARTEAIAASIRTLLGVTTQLGKYSSSGTNKVATMTADDPDYGVYDIADQQSEAGNGYGNLSTQVLTGKPDNRQINGIYFLEDWDGGTSPVLKRTSDADAGTEFKGMAMFVRSGSGSSGQADTGWVCTNDNDPSFTAPADGPMFTQFTGAGGITAGNGISKVGDTISVNINPTYFDFQNSLLNIKGGSIDVNALGVNAVNFAKLAIVPVMETITLPANHNSNDVDLTKFQSSGDNAWKEGLLVTKNGLMQRFVGGSPADSSEYSVSYPNGTSTRLTFGGSNNANNGDTIMVFGFKLP